MKETSLQQAAQIVQAVLDAGLPFVKLVPVADGGFSVVIFEYPLHVDIEVTDEGDIVWAVSSNGANYVWGLSSIEALPEALKTIKSYFEVGG